MHPVELETTTIEFVPLTLIDPNPYQPREGEDQEHIQKIAASIAAEGLLQIPTGRRVDSKHGGAARVQLAFGHTRLAAYWLLYQVQADLEDHKAIDFEDDSLMQQVVLAADAALEKGIRFKAMPLSIRSLSDEDMFRMAVGENLARKDLTALEEARAMLVYRDQFGKTSAQIGALFGKNESTIRGKLRLLNLPADLQQQLAGVSEMVLREILYMLELPDEYRQRVEQHYEPFIKPSMILRAAIGGENHGQIAERVNRLVTFWSRELNGDWKHDREDWPAGEAILGACKGCAFRRQREGKQICLKRACYDLKERVMRREYLAQASQACGVPVLEAEKEDGSLSTFTYSDEKKIETALSVGKEVSRAATRQKRQNAEEVKAMRAEEVKAMRAELTQLIAAALTSDNPAVWLRVLQRYEWGLANKHRQQDWQDDWHGHAQELRLEIAKKITEQLYDTSYSEPVPARALALFNDFLKEARLPILEPAQEMES